VERVVIATVVVIVAVVVAVLVERRKPAAPTQGSWSVPAQLDRNDFDRPEAPWLVAVFTSATCESCAQARDKAVVLASAEVVVQEVEVSARRDLHDRYAIAAVPTVLVADGDGVVQASFVGPPTATDLWAALADARSRSAQPPT
jgi:hypothetical protein